MKTSHSFLIYYIKATAPPRKHYVILIKRVCPLNARGMVFRVLTRESARGYNFKNVKVGVCALQYIY